MDERSSKEKVLNRALYTLVRHVDLTPEEVSTLRLADLHLAGKSPNLSVHSAEGGQAKTVDLDLEAHRALVGWLVARPDSTNDYLFPGPEDGELTPHDIRQAVKAAEQEIEVTTKPLEPQAAAGDQAAAADLSEASPADDFKTVDEGLASPPGSGSSPIRPVSAMPPPSAPEMGAPPREAGTTVPFPPPPPPTSSPEEGRLPAEPGAGPKARPFPGQPFPPTTNDHLDKPQAGAASGPRIDDSSSRSVDRPEDVTGPSPVRERRPRIPPKPVRRRGSEPAPVIIPGMEPEQPAVPGDKDRVEPVEASEPDAELPPSTSTEAKVAAVAAATAAAAASTEETTARASEAAPVPGPAADSSPKTEGSTPAPPPPIPQEGVNRPAIFSFAAGGGMVVLAVCIICVVGGSWFAIQSGPGGQFAAGLGLGQAGTVEEEATRSAAATATGLAEEGAGPAEAPSPTATLPPTSTFTPLPATATPIPSETPSPEPQQTEAPTETPVPTETPSPTDTPPPAETPTPADTPTPEATPTPAMKFAAPVLIEPEDQFRFISGNTIVLRWQPVDLAADEQYAVRLAYRSNGQPAFGGANIKEPEWTVPLALFGKVDPPENFYEWFVVVERLNEDGSGTAISPESERRSFTWK
jgi:hypothetical protein